MRKICKEKLKLERFELPREEALKFMEEKGEPYKVELIHDLPEDAHISFYKQGEFTDLCAGPASGFYRPRKGQRHQADRLQRRLLAGRLQPGDPPADLRHRFPQEGRAGPTSSALRRPEARSPQAGEGAGPVHHYGRGPRLPLLPAPRHGAEEHPHRLLAAGAQALRLCGDLYPIMLNRSCGSAPVTGITTSRTCTPPSSMTRITQSSR